MRLLREVEGSVLWLLGTSEATTRNLRNEARLRGIDPQRLVFAPKTEISQHLARHRAADLFLDNLPVNAHTAASDALWVGLPVVTCAGDAFIGRVAPGGAVNAMLDAYPDWTIPASVIAIVPTANREKATVKVRIRFEKKDPRIRECLE